MLSGFLTINALMILPHVGNIHNYRISLFPAQDKMIQATSHMAQVKFCCYYRALHYMYS